MLLRLESLLGRYQGLQQTLQRNSCLLPEHCLNWIKLIFNQRIEHRCAKYNLTEEEEEQWEPSNINSDNDELSNTNNESKEHDSDEINIYTTREGEDEDKDDGEEYLHIGEKVDMEGAEKWYRLGERILRMKKERRELLEKEHCKKKKVNASATNLISTINLILSHAYDMPQNTR